MWTHCSHALHKFNYIWASVRPLHRTISQPSLQPARWIKVNLRRSVRPLDLVVPTSTCPMMKLDGETASSSWNPRATCSVRDSGLGGRRLG